MNINPMGQEQWMAEFQAATKSLVGRCLSREELAPFAEHLTEEWFQQTSPRVAALKTVATLFEQDVVKAKPCRGMRKAA